jgi:hypothetical protein
MPEAPKADEPVVCVPKRLPKKLWVEAARNAAAINPLNYPPVNRLMMVNKSFKPTPQSIAVLTTKFWGNKGVKLTVGFLDNPSSAMKSRILSHMNAWAKTANVKFVASSTDPQVRITRLPNDGHWSYLGTDILTIPKNEATMNLDSFTMRTPESEYIRVVRHETGHTLGCPHEHMRRALVKLIDPKLAIEFFGETQGWSPQMVRRQVLTPIEESSLLGTADSDPNSIMCYQIPGDITRNGKPILGGADIDEWDYSFMATIYPKPSAAGGSKGAKKAAAGKKRATRKSKKARKRKP